MGASSARCRADRFAAAGDDSGDLSRTYRASFGQQDDVEPIIVTPPGDGRLASAVSSAEVAKTYLPITAAIYTANGLFG